jgi:hypothetical protein
MTTLRPLLAVLLIQTASAAWSAPLPVPKPARGEAEVEKLKGDIGGYGVLVRSVKPVDAGRWAVTFFDRRGAVCGTRSRHVAEPLCLRVVEGPDRAAALRRLLEEIRKEDEQRFRRLREAGVIR